MNTTHNISSPFRRNRSPGVASSGASDATGITNPARSSPLRAIHDVDHSPYAISAHTSPPRSSYTSPIRSKYASPTRPDSLNVQFDSVRVAAAVPSDNLQTKESEVFDLQNEIERLRIETEATNALRLAQEAHHLALIDRIKEHDTDVATPVSSAPPSPDRSLASVELSQTLDFLHSLEKTSAAKERRFEEEKQELMAQIARLQAAADKDTVNYNIIYFFFLFFLIFYLVCICMCMCFDNNLDNADNADNADNV